MHRMCISAAALLLALSSLAPAPARAITFEDLYTLTVTPEPGAGNRRVAAEQGAMRQLLERVTGDRAAALEPDLASMVENAADYVSSYGTLAGGQIQVGFIASAVNRELEARGRPVWGPERPLTLLWIAVDGGRGERVLLGADASTTELSPEMAQLTDSIRTELTEVASERGLPVLMPLLDLEDLGAIDSADVWGGFDRRIEQASARYGADAILVGRVLATEFGNNVQWTLLRGAERRAMAGEAVSEGLHWVADQYAQEYSVVGGVRTLRVVVQGVQSLADYGRVMSYLGGLSSLQSIDVESLADDALTLRVAARGDAGVIERTFSIGRVLEPATTGLGSGDERSSANTLVFKIARAGLPQ
jgi:hypothetical protein